MDETENEKQKRNGGHNLTDSEPLTHPCRLIGNESFVTADDFGYYWQDFECRGNIRFREWYGGKEIGGKAGWYAILVFEN